MSECGRRLAAVVAGTASVCVWVGESVPTADIRACGGSLGRRKSPRIDQPRVMMTAVGGGMVFLSTAHALPGVGDDGERQSRASAPARFVRLTALSQHPSVTRLSRSCHACHAPGGLRGRSISETDC